MWKDIKFAIRERKEDGVCVWHLEKWKKDINPLKTEHICLIQGLSAYRAVNTLHFGYKNQSLNVL
jgi:hypothetical protein